MRRAGIAQDQTLFELKQNVRMNSEGMNNVLIHPELHEIEATKDRCILVLPAASDTKVEALGLKCQLCKFVQIPSILAKLIKAA